MRPTVQCHLLNGPFGDPVPFADMAHHSDALLFDIGDIAVLPPRQAQRIKYVFISHMHMDHFASFDGLLRLMLGRDKTIAFYGPAGFIAGVRRKLLAYTWNTIGNYPGNLVLSVHEVHGDGSLLTTRFQSRSAFQEEQTVETKLLDNVLAATDFLTVRCAVPDHDIPCLAFALEEVAHVHIWKTRFNELGLVVGPWLRELKGAILRGDPDTSELDALQRAPHGVMPIRRRLADLRPVARVSAGQKIAYVVDVRYHPANAEQIQRLAFGADLLFIECAFAEADAAHAARKNHPAAWRAGLLARQARVKRLVPCRFSTRYRERGDILSEEAQRALYGAPVRQAEDRG